VSTYSVDAIYSGNTAQIVTQVVSAAGRASIYPHGFELVCDPDYPRPSAHVESRSDLQRGTSSGTVSFNSTTLLGAVSLDTTGQANLTTSSLALGMHSITAIYVGNSSFCGAPGHRRSVWRREWHA
jgi:hypothetical protein